MTLCGTLVYLGNKYGVAFVIMSVRESLPIRTVIFFRI